MGAVPATSTTPVLTARDIRVHFGHVKAVDGVDVTVSQDEILGLIGPNGAGKTTLVNVLSGFQRPKSGTIELAGRDVTSWAAHEIALAGLCRTFQAVRAFATLTVFENVEAAALAGGANRRAARDVAHVVLERLSLLDVASQRADALSHGTERRLGVARALATKPLFLLLDEPAAGLDDSESDELVAALREIHTSFSVGLLVIEHDMKVIMGLCHRLQVLDYGQTIAIGTPSEIRMNPDVQRAYLGSVEDRHA